MNVQLALRMDKLEFLTWVQAHEGRFEPAGNRVVMMTGGSRGHAIFVRRLAAALRSEPKAVDAVVEIASLGIDLPLAEIYAGVEHR
jgi:hypothetical protein